MANRPSHGLQERIIAFVASKPDRLISRNGSRESCATWIGKRLFATEKAVLAELEALETQGKIKITRGTVDRGIKTVQVHHSVEPEEWAMQEVLAHSEPVEAPQFQLPADLDYRQLGESVLLAALAALSSTSSTEARQKVVEEEIADLRDTNVELRSEVSHTKAERDAAIRAKKVAEDAARAQKDRSDEALTRVAELEGDIAQMEQHVATLQQQLRTVSVLEDLDPDDRIAVGTALAKLIEEQK